MQQSEYEVKRVVLCVQFCPSTLVWALEIDLRQAHSAKNKVDYLIKHTKLSSGFHMHEHTCAHEYTQTYMRLFTTFIA